MNACDTLAGLLETRWGTTKNWAAKLIEQMAAAGFVVVACPPGSRVVVDRTPKPCETCEGKGWEGPSIKGAVMSRDTVRCRPCRGSGVVEATTIHGLAEVRLGWIDEDGAERPLHPFAVERMLYDETLYRMIALPEETPQ